MDEKKIIELYNSGHTLRHISDIFNSNHHMIRRILVRNGIEIIRKKTLKPFTDEHKQKISDSRKKLALNGYVPYNKGLKTVTRKCKNGVCGLDLLYKNMKAHLKYDVSIEWLSKFEDIEKLKFLNKSISRKRDCEGFTTEIYIQFIERFYIDSKFNELYHKWIETNDKWIKPSLDHIEAKCNGGSLLIDNLQFISWLENRAKVDIDQELWNKMKQNINYYL